MKSKIRTPIESGVEIQSSAKAGAHFRGPCLVAWKKVVVREWIRTTESVSQRIYSIARAYYAPVSSTTFAARLGGES